MDDSLTIGSDVLINDKGKRFLSDFFKFEQFLNKDGELVGKLIDDEVFPTVQIHGYSAEVFNFGKGEVEAYIKKARITVTQLVELLTTYRMSDDEDEVMAAQEELIALYLEG